VTVKYITAIKAMFFCFDLCLCGMLDSISCSFTSIKIFSFSIEAEVNEQDNNGLTPLHLTLGGQQRQLPGVRALFYNYVLDH